VPPVAAVGATLLFLDLEGAESRQLTADSRQ
jgi:hypothetical protein